MVRTLSGERRYQINPDLRVSYDGDQIVIESASNTYSLSDKNLWPFISEVLSTTEDLAIPEPGDEYSSSDIARLRSAFELLAETEVLVPSDGSSWPDTIVSLANRSGGIVSLQDIVERLETAKIVVVDPHNLCVVDTLISTMREYPIALPEVVRQMPKQSSADLMVMVACDEHDPFLDEANKLALGSDIRVWVPLIPARGGRFRVGPWFYPNQSACYQCLRLRSGSVERESALASIQRRGQSAAPRHDRFDSQPAMTLMMVSMLSDAILTHIALDGAQGQAPVGGFADVTYGLEGFELSNHRVLRVPRCPQCSPASGTGYPQIWFHEE